MPRARPERVEVPTDQNPEADGASVVDDTQQGEGIEGTEPGTADAGAADTGPRTDIGSGEPGYGDIGANASRHPLDDGDPRIIRDENGNPTFSPSGRLRKRRASGPRQTDGIQSTRRTPKKIPVDALSRLLMMGHAIGANLTRTPELEINSGEAKMLADPLSELLLLYEVEPDPRIMAMMELGLAASYVYGPRFTMIRLRLRAEAAARAAARKEAEQRTINPAVGGEVAVFQPVDITNGGPLGGIRH